MDSVDYVQIVVLVVGAIGGYFKYSSTLATLTARLDANEAEIDDLKRENIELRATNDKLQAKINELTERLIKAVKGSGRVF